MPCHRPDLGFEFPHGQAMYQRSVSPELSRTGQSVDCLYANQTGHAPYRADAGGITPGHDKLVGRYMRASKAQLTREILPVQIIHVVRSARISGTGRFMPSPGG